MAQRVHSELQRSIVCGAEGALRATRSIVCGTELQRSIVCVAEGARPLTLRQAVASHCCTNFREYIREVTLCVPHACRMMYMIIARAELEHADNSRSSTAGNPRFAQQNPRMVKIRTLHLPYMYTYVYIYIF